VKAYRIVPDLKGDRLDIHGNRVRFEEVGKPTHQEWEARVKEKKDRARERNRRRAKDSRASRKRNRT
jgi:hypothetical protein